MTRCRASEPGTAGGRRRVVIDSQASRAPPGGGPPQSSQPPRRQRRGRRRRGVYDEEAESRPSRTPSADPGTVRINSGSTVKDVAEYLNVPVPEIMKKLMALGEMKTLTQTLSDESIQVLATELGKEVEIVHSEDEAVDRAGVRRRRGGSRRARAGGHDHGPRRPRQDLAARRDPRDRGGRRRGRRHHPAHRRLPGPPRRQDWSPSSTPRATRRSRRCAPAAPRSPTSR